MKLLRLVQSDLYRVTRKKSFSSLLRAYFVAPQFKIVFWYRLANFFRNRKGLGFVFVFCALMLHRLRIRYVVSLFSGTEIGPGFLIGHIGGIVINSQAKIGRNCTVLHGVTIGASDHQAKPGLPRIGDNVYVGAGAKILGDITIGNNVVVGANCVVIRDVPDNGVVVGIPGRVVSDAGSGSYLRNVEIEE